MAALVVVLGTLLPGRAYRIATTEVATWTSWDMVTQPAVQAHGTILLGYVPTLAGERILNEGKARWLSVAYRLLALAIVGAAIAGGTLWYEAWQG